jgi:hypothetical protein
VPPVHVADYTALRAFAGSANSVHVTGYSATSAPSGIAGTFTRDATVTVDNGGTEIVGVHGWKRVFDGAVNAGWFGALGDGATNDTAAINAAITVASTIGGVVQLTAGKVYRATGIAPKNGVTLDGCGATIKPIAGAAAPMFFYNSDVDLVGFNLSNLTLDGNLVAQNIINITQPTPTVPDKTWSYSTLFNVAIINSGAIGLYCQVPGRVRLIGCRVQYNDIGLAWDREHIDVYNTSVEYNRIGVRSTGNHFTWTHGVIAHNTEKGWTTSGAGLGTFTDIYEGAFIGCTFIDNGTHSLQGLLNRCRVSGTRFLDATTHIANAQSTSVVGCQFAGTFTWAMDDIGTACVVSGNVIGEGVNGIRSKLGGERILITGNELIGLTGEGIRLQRPVRSKVTENVIGSCAAGIYLDATAGSIAFAIDRNLLNTITGVGVNLPNSVDAADWSISGNQITQCGLEGIKIAGASNNLGARVNDNQIIDCNTTNTANTDAIFSSGTHTANQFCGNTLRNSGSGKMSFGIRFSGSALDSLFDGNVARNMLGAQSYDLPATGFTVGSNVGTFAP